jgi:multiple sugar transport system substrate-binding protein
MANPEAPRPEIEEATGDHQLSRRQVLGGLAGVAGLAAVPSLIAACGPGATTTSSPTGSQPAGSQPAPSQPATGTVKIGSNNSDPTPLKAMEAVVAAFEAETGINVELNTVSHGPFQDNLSQYLQGTPDDVITWFSGHRMRFFANQGLFTPIDDVWATVSSNYSDAMKAAATHDDGKVYLIPFNTYAWTVYYRKSVWADKGYTIPTTLDEFKTLAQKMKDDGLVPIGLGDQDGWPAQGHFDIINLRENGFQYHIDLMNGMAKWSDPQVKKVFEVWKTLLPFYQENAAGRKWQDAAAGLVQKTTGMMLQPQVGETFVAAGETEFADLDHFPWPNHGTEWDAEKSLDAPIDGFMLTSKSPTLSENMDAAKAFLEFVAKGSTQQIFVKEQAAFIGAANDVDQSKYTPVQQKQVEVIGAAKSVAQFLDRDTRSDFAGAQGMQAFLINFLQKPDQDLDAFLKGIQSYYDSLGPEA